MGCFGSKEENNDGSGGPPRPKKEKKPEIPPDPAQPETEKAKELRDRILEALEVDKLSKKVWNKTLTLKELDVEGWEDFGFMQECTEVKEINLSYSSFDSTGFPSLFNCVRCKTLNLQNCDNLEETEESEWKFPKLLNELDVTESNFLSWNKVAQCKYLKILTASGQDAECVVTTLPDSLTSLDVGATEFNDKEMLLKHKNLKRIDLQGCEGDLSGKWNGSPDWNYFNVSATNFDDDEFLSKLEGKGCEIVRAIS